MSGPVDEQLRALAGPEPYRRNAFRLSGLPTEASGRAIRGRRQKVLTALSAGVALPSVGELPVEADEAGTRAAFEELGDSRRRVVHEVLWLWGPSNAGCGCPSGLHADHDQAVLAHAQALDAELHGEDQEIADALWPAAAELWSRTLRRAAVWDHVRYRIKELDDRRLDEADVDVLRDGLPRTLIMPIAELAVKSDEPERLAAHARRWDLSGRVVDEAFDEVTEPVLRQVDEQITQINQKVKREEPHQTVDDPLPEESAQVHWEAIAVAREAVATLVRLDPLLPESRRLVQLKESCGVRLNNSALRLKMRPEIPVGELIEVVEEAQHATRNPNERQIQQRNINHLVRCQKEN